MMSVMQANTSKERQKGKPTNGEKEGNPLAYTTVSLASIWSQYILEPLLNIRYSGRPCAYAHATEHHRQDYDIIQESSYQPFGGGNAILVSRATVE